MSGPILPPYPAEDSWLDKLQAAIEVLLLSGLVSGFFAAIPFSFRTENQASGILMNAHLVSASILLEAWIFFVLLWIVLRLHRETLRSLGLRLAGWRTETMVGLAVVPILFVSNVIVAAGFRYFLPKYYLERNPLTEMIRTSTDLALFITSALIAGGIKEELQRAFILTRFRQHLGGAGVGLVVWSLAFGVQHYVQGVQGIVAATLFGFLFGAVYLARRNIVAPIVAHGLYDTLALLGYWFTRQSR